MSQENLFQHSNLLFLYLREILVMQELVNGFFVFSLVLFKVTDVRRFFPTLGCYVSSCLGMLCYHLVLYETVVNVKIRPGDI